MKKLFVLSALLSLFVSITFADDARLVSTQRFCNETNPGEVLTLNSFFTFELYTEQIETTFSGTWKWENDSYESIKGNIIDINAPQEILDQYGWKESNDDVNMPFQIEVTCGKSPLGIIIGEVRFNGNVFKKCSEN